ncbi:retropepsin-like aspartic protease [Pedobacter punctiformis]|uniref:Retropepsin-like aspartic protease n=1 Tax=Pedobacter punctiformis TaxID=3004097 RepID=A0ABT4LAU9_9SPHI|nr:retropepsin-like aspartic protease [Pedobacter sp. HCMS5-2]MCZ4245046.1 retropepsin-like aspartic protease [Pedobacter sp. HCMS5-2]
MKLIYHKLLVLFSCCFFINTLYAQDVTVLPYSVIANKMIVEVRLNGKPVSMIFDTGGRNSISKRLKETLELSVVQSTALTDANSNKMETDIVNLDQVEMCDGKVKFKSVPFYVFDYELFACLGVEGFVGSDLFQNNTVEIDDQAKEIRIRAGGMPGLSSDRRAIPFTDDAGGMPVISLNMGKYDEAKVLFDTGSDGFLTLRRDEYARLEQQEALHVIREGEGGGSIGASGRGDIGKRILVEVPEMIVGKASFSNFRASVGSPPKTLFGYKSLQYGKVTIDYVNKLFRFEALKAGPIEVDSKKSWDLEMRIDGNQMVIATVWDKIKGEAEVGDIVTHINGKEIKPMTVCESITSGLSVLKENDQVVLTVKTKQGTKDITINKH